MARFTTYESAGASVATFICDALKIAVCILRNEDASKHIMDCLIRCGHSAESNLRNKEVMDCLIRYGHSAVCMLRNDDASKHIMDRSIRCGHSAESNLRNEPRCN